MTNRPDLSQRRTKVTVKPAPDLDTDPIDLAPSSRLVGGATRPAPTVPLTTETVRITTDLAPSEYRTLIACAADVAADLGKARVPHTRVVRALVARLEADPELKAKVVDVIREQSRK
jgi:hypothetical protein